MAMVFGTELTKKELLKRVGSIDAIAGVRRSVLQDGRARGMQVYEVNNGRIRFNVFIDKCMDVGELYYDGMPLYFLARPGIINNNYWYDGANSPRSIMCGMMFTCGLGNVGPMQEGGGSVQPQHGFIRNSPAEQHGARCYWEGDDYYIELTGLMREASLFGENITLRRRITTKLGEECIHIHDEIENENVSPAPLMLMYHCNAGYPLLDKNSRMVFDALSSKGRDKVADEGMKAESFKVFGEPENGYAEQVFYHKLADKNGRCAATMVNPDKKLAFTIDFENKELPYLIHWKCKASGDYVTGIEPSNCHPEGVNKEKADGTLRVLAPHEKIETDINFRVSSGEAAVALLK